jgi:hypothetical protein
MYCLQTYAQTGDHKLHLDEKPLNTEVDAFKELLNKNTRVGYSMTLKYRNVKFINPTYQQSLKEGFLEQKLGYEVGMSFIAHPVEFEIIGFSTKYESDLIDSLKHRGIEFFCDLNVLPYAGKVSKYLYPYIGLGYQTSQIKAYSSSISTGSFMFKGGIKIYLGCRLFLCGEYKQGFPLSKKTLFRAWSVGLGFSV